MLLSAVVMFALSISAVAQEITKRDRFELWAHCKPMRLIIETSYPGQYSIDLQTRGETMLRSKLRGARLYDPDETTMFLTATMIVNALPEGWVFFYDLSFWKPVFSTTIHEFGHLPDDIRPLATWQTNNFGAYSDGYEHIVLDELSGASDHFIDEYLRVNAEACS